MLYKEHSLLCIKAIEKNKDQSHWDFQRDKMHINIKRAKASKHGLIFLSIRNYSVSVKIRRDTLKILK